jgi:hypothetical protein
VPSGSVNCALGAYGARVFAARAAPSSISRRDHNARLTAGARLTQLLVPLPLLAERAASPASPWPSRTSRAEILAVGAGFACARVPAGLRSRARARPGPAFCAPARRRRQSRA